MCKCEPRARTLRQTHTHTELFFIRICCIYSFGRRRRRRRREQKKKQTNVRNSASVFEGCAHRAHNAWPLIWTKSILWKKKKASQQTMHFIYVWWWCESAHARHFTVAWQQCNPTHPTKRPTDVETNEACNQSTPWCRLAAQFDFDVCFYSFC